MGVQVLSLRLTRKGNTIVAGGYHDRKETPMIAHGEYGGGNEMSEGDKKAAGCFMIGGLMSMLVWLVPIMLCLFFCLLAMCSGG